LEWANLCWQLFSPKFNLEWGLPQGLALSPDLYLLFISDLILILNEHDSNFPLVMVRSFGISFREFLIWLEQKGQLLLNSLSIYCKTWLIDLNPAKTVYQLSESPIGIPDITLFYEGYRLMCFKTFRYLGYDLRSNVSMTTLRTTGIRLNSSQLRLVDD